MALQDQGSVLARLRGFREEGATIEQGMEILYDLRNVRVQVPDDALVVRGGLSEVETLRDNALDTFEAFGLWGVSAACGVTVDPQSLLRQYPVPNPSVRSTHAGIVREAGFELALTFRPGHLSILLTVNSETEPADAVLEALRDCFGAPEENPIRK